ncbi:hypothetical protein BD408DRAFT_85847 [Parasitella parasitica]|nr:hypothetical protein BD408DRAFT_85847 [Parasitella parasitica]
MKTTGLSILSSSISNKNNKWRYLVHLAYITILISLSITIPIVYSLTGTPPYWAITILFVIPFLIYVLLLMIIRPKNTITTATTTTVTSVPVADMEQDQDEITGLQRHIIDEEAEDNDDGVLSSIDNTSYNPSTVGIPPSSFLAPTIHPQASIRSSSLDYTPPPPAYQDMIYPPSYRSTNSTKDDNVSIVY